MSVQKETISYKDFDKTTRFLHPKFDRNNFPVAEFIPTMDEILEEIVDESGEKRMGRRLIRYIAGEKSIYADKQNDKAAEKKQSTIMMREGSLILSNREVTLLEYLRKCDYNGSKPNRDTRKNILFMENKPAEKAAAFLSNDFKDLELKLQIHKMEISELEMYALALNIPNPEDKPSEELRRDMLILAEREPKLFQDGMKNMPKMKRKYHVSKASQIGIIRVEGNRVSWANGGVIVQAPIGKDPIEYLVDFTYEEVGEEVYTEIQKSLYPNKLAQSVPDEIKVKLSESVQKSAPSPDSPYYELIAQASAQKVIIKRGPVWIGLAEAVQGDPYYSFSKGESGLIEAFRKNPELVETIKSRLK